MLTKRPDLRFKAGFGETVTWGKPDAPARPLCGVCHGPLPDVPLMIWRSDGAMVQLCDSCVEKWIEEAA